MIPKSKMVTEAKIAEITSRDVTINYFGASGVDAHVKAWGGNKGITLTVDAVPFFLNPAFKGKIGRAHV